MLQNLKNAGSAVGNANKVRQQQAKLQKILQEIRVTGTSKNGKVTVTIDGEQDPKDFMIDPALFRFVYENFFDPAVLTGTDEENQTKIQKGHKFYAAPAMEAIKDATSKIQGEIVKKIQETGSMGDLMSMLQAAGSAGA